MSNSTHLAERLDFVCLGVAERHLLAEFRPVIDRELPGILADFYDQVRRFPDVAKLFGGQAAIDRASRAQATHWNKLFSGRFDDDYYASARAIGHMHSRIGLDPRWYQGGYAFILARLCTLATKHALGRFSFGGKDRAAALTAALSKAVMLDAEVAISVYIEENKVAYDRKLSDLGAAFEKNVSALVTDLTQSAGEMEAAADSMAGAAGDTNQRAMAVAAASEQASASIQTVSSSAEQLRVSISEIRKQVEESVSSTQSAVTSAKRTDDIVRALADGAEKIGMVIDMIGQIANKTNILALNASVEAARAGDAGRAFEVVAAEVKELAMQTARATADISSQIQHVQNASRDAVTAIGQISSSVDRLSVISANISGAIREQDLATNDITRNVQQTAIAANEVSTNIVTVSNISDKAGSTAAAVLDSARHVSNNAHGLSAQLGHFLANLRAA